MGGATAGVAVAAMRARQRVVSHFLSHDAVSPDKAVPYTPTRRLERKVFERLRNDSVIVTAVGGAFWIDVPKLDAFQTQRRKRVGMGVGLLAAMIGAGVAIGLLG